MSLNEVSHKIASGEIPPELFDISDVEHPVYKMHMGNETTWDNVAGPMFAEAIGKPIKPVPLAKLRELFLTSMTPSIKSMLKDKDIGISTSTLYRLKDELVRSGYLQDDLVFSPKFYLYYLKLASEYAEEVSCMDTEVRDTEYTGEVPIRWMFTYDTVVDVVERYSESVFLLPGEYEVASKIDFTSDKVQFVELSNYSGCNRVHKVLRYTNRCNVCQRAEHFTKETKPYKCGHIKDKSRCVGMMMPENGEYVERHMFNAKLPYENSTIHAFSFIDLPIGTFTAAVIRCINSSRNGYYLLILAIKKKVYPTSTYVPRPGKHAVFQLIDDINEVHMQAYGDYIRGLDITKAAVIFSIFGNLCGFKSYNTMLFGRSGSGKSIVAFAFSHTITNSSTYIDTSTTSLSGLVGSVVREEVDGQIIAFLDMGALSHYIVVVLDEFTSNRLLMPHIKTCLDNNELTKQVSGANFRVPKAGCVIATANINSSHLVSMRREFTRYKLMYESIESSEQYGVSKDHNAFRYFDEYTEKAMEKYGDTDNVELIVHESILLREKARSKNYIDGEDLSSLNRFPFIFYVGEDGKGSADDYKPSDGEAVNFLIGSTEGHERLYTPAFMEYLNYCAGLKVVIPTNMKDAVDNLYYQMYEYDHIHSVGGRLASHIQRMVKWSAALNGRTEVNYVDLLFVKDFWTRTCRYYEPSQYTRKPYWEFEVTNEDAKERFLNGSPVAKPVKIGSTEDSIMDTIDMELCDYQFDDDELAVIKPHISHVVSMLMNEYKLTKLDAKRFVDVYISRRLKEEIVTDPTVEIINCKPEPFMAAPDDLSVNGLSDYLFGEFSIHKTIPESSIISLVQRYGVDPMLVTKAMKHISPKLDRLGDAYKLKAEWSA